ncbi:YraN family protein [bacterium]|nr:YraN family protein [bacterium]
MSHDRLATGKKGEQLAEKYLKRKGFRAVARNLRRKSGELDLLMWDGDELVIIEVRTVHLLGGYDPSDKVPPSKQKQLLRVAEALVAELPDPLPPVRIDVCVVELEPKVTIHHFVDAVRPGRV